MTLPRPASPGPAAPRPLESGPAEEQRLAGSPAAQAVNAALLGLSRTARSFTLYASNNEMVRTLVAEYREKMRHALDVAGTVKLEVRPFEFALGREVVYREMDRERSLAFRLFRDGLRELSIAKDATWEEILGLLEVFSVRYTGVRQQEDDFVTLLRKADFKRVTFEAVEGFVPDEENPEPPLDEGGSNQAAVDRAPPGWDVPPPAFKEMGTAQFLAVAPERLQPLRDEESLDALARSAVTAVRDMLQLVRGASGPTDLDEVLLFAGEIREFLLIEDQAERLADLTRMLAAALAHDPARLKAMCLGHLDARALGLLSRWGAAEPDRLIAAVGPLVDVEAVEMLRRMAEMIGEKPGPGEPALLKLVARAAAAPGGADALLANTREAEGRSRLVLFGILRDVDPARAVRIAGELQGGDATSREAALLALEVSPIGAEMLGLAKRLLEAPEEAIRVKTIEVLVKRGGQRAYPVILAHLEKHAEAGLPDAEADAAGRALARLSPKTALQSFEGWIAPKPKGLLQRIVKSRPPAALVRAAVSGLEFVPDPRAVELIQEVAKDAKDALRAHCAAVLGRRRGGKAP